MSIPTNSIASATAVSTQFQNRTGGTADNVPQRIAVLAQGASAYSYATAKRVVTSHQDAGAVEGWGSPAHSILQELFPDYGEGVGSVEVTLFPLAADVSGVAATGDVTPSGTQLVAAEYRLSAGAVESGAFTIAKGAVVVNDLLRKMGSAVNAVLHMPVTASFEYGSVTMAVGVGNAGNGTLATLSATGTPAPGDWSLECVAAATDGGTFKLTDPDGTIVSTLIDVSGAPQAAGGITFTLSDGSSDFEAGDLFTITVPATKLNFVAKWAGLSSNRIPLKIIGDTTLGVSFAFTAMNGGLVDPTVDAALALFGENTWYTKVINALDPHNTTALDTFQTFGEAKWGQLIHTPLVVYRGNNEADRAMAVGSTASRTDDRVNVQLVAPGAQNMPHVIAAAQVAKIASMANSNPAHGYGGLVCLTLTPGADYEQWNNAEREAALAAGSSTVEIADGKLVIGDVITSYKPDGQAFPAYRFVPDIVKLQQVLYNVYNTFAAGGYRSAPLIKDGETSDNATAKTPSMLTAAINGVLTALANGAILTDIKTTRASTATTITGPRSVTVESSLTLAGNVDQISVDMVWGFLTGS
jgi:phage tail sheath gpL-like